MHLGLFASSSDEECYLTFTRRYFGVTNMWSLVDLTTRDLKPPTISLLLLVLELLPCRPSLLVFCLAVLCVSSASI